MPTTIDVERKRPVRLDSPLHVIEVQLGAVLARDRDGHVAEGKAGETVDAVALAPPIQLTATEGPCRVRIVYDSEARGYAAQRKRKAEREAAKAAQGEAAKPETRPPMQPPIH